MKDKYLKHKIFLLVLVLIILFQLIRDWNDFFRGITGT